MLQQFGFSQYESKVFEVLAQSDTPLDATTIVKHSGIPKAKIYEVLTRMIDKGMVLDSISEKKKLYIALPVAQVIEKLSAEFAASMKQLEEQTRKRSFHDENVWSLKVESSIQAQAHAMLAEATTSIRLSGWNEHLAEYVPLLEEKERQGVEVEVLTVGVLPSTLTNVHVLVPAQGHAALEPFRLLIVDDREVLFAGVEAEAWQALKTQSRPITKVFTEFFYHDVALTKINEKHGAMLLEDDEIRTLLMKLRY